MIEELNRNVKCDQKGEDEWKGRRTVVSFFNVSATKKFSKGTNASIFRVHQIKHPTLIADEKSRAATKQVHWHLTPQMK